MTNAPPPRQITFEDAIQWLREHAAAMGEMAQLQAKTDALARKIEAAKVLFPDLESHTPPAVKALAIEPHSVTTWRELVFFALSRATGGLTQAQMLKAGLDTAMAERVRKSPNGLYVSVKKMEAREEIHRDGQHFYMPELWDRIQRGEIEDDREELGLNAGGIQQTVLSFMRDGKPHRAREIEDFLKDNPATARQVRLNPSYIYNLLSRMFRNERLDKLEDGVYVIRKENEPSTGFTRDGSDAGGADTPLFENVTRFPGAR